MNINDKTIGRAELKGLCLRPMQFVAKNICCNSVWMDLQVNFKKLLAHFKVT